MYVNVITFKYFVGILFCIYFVYTLPSNADIKNYVSYGVYETLSCAACASATCFVCLTHRASIDGCSCINRNKMIILKILYTLVEFLLKTIQSIRLPSLFYVLNSKRMFFAYGLRLASNIIIFTNSVVLRISGYRKAMLSLSICSFAPCTVKKSKKYFLGVENHPLGHEQVPVLKT